MKRGVFAQLLREREAFYDRVLSGAGVVGLIMHLLLGCIILLGIYGLVMGSYNSLLQAVSSAVKVPLLFLLALVICYPALFIFNILLGSQLRFGQSLAMILSAFGLTACVLASFAPIALFFMLIGSSYTFLRLLHVVIFSVSALAGMKTLNDGLIYACEKYSVYPRQGVRVFKVWVLIFAFVGTQLAWNLRPFVGNKELEFQLFRKQESNFYAHMFHTAIDFLGGSPEKKSMPEKPLTWSEYTKKLEEAGDIEGKVQQLRDSLDTTDHDAE